MYQLQPNLLAPTIALLGDRERTSSCSPVNAPNRIWVGLGKDSHNHETRPIDQSDLEDNLWKVWLILYWLLHGKRQRKYRVHRM